MKTMLYILIIAAMLVSCGGGGGGRVVVPPSNDASPELLYQKETVGGNLYGSHITVAVEPNYGTGYIEYDADASTVPLHFTATVSFYTSSGQFVEKQTFERTLDVEHMGFSSEGFNIADGVYLLFIDAYTITEAT